jgi:hypothetical protein
MIARSRKPRLAASFAEPHLARMILTPIAPEALAGLLDRFSEGLTDPLARRAFALIRATSAKRAQGEDAERHRQAALALARSFGMRVHAEGHPCPFNWDGKALNGGVEAYVILHEAAHFALAPPSRRLLAEFGLGPGPDTLDREAAEKAAGLSLFEREEDEALSSLLGILWEAALGQPALASFLDQNWLEGSDRNAARHFTSVLRALSQRRMLDADARTPAAIAPALAQPTRLR